ncbi:hypothetical protein psyc5s11_36460 [Clostridium gelidum]|uniref:Uncharacterized protein n=1 Tax=Clostridium gelidum TaxID=704125 RepID=A0ABM7T6D7_9CLOT|nr:hypothetical protein [Clostridium gelidum]BCZ47579.1 hypothetical protein psyc5s11_36460 [Clostridium gelidum]
MNVIEYIMLGNSATVVELPTFIWISDVACFEITQDWITYRINVKTLNKGAGKVFEIYIID